MMTDGFDAGNILVLIRDLTYHIADTNEPIKLQNKDFTLNPVTFRQC